MESDRFDRLTRTLAAGHTRRATVWLLTLSVVAPFWPSSIDGTLAASACGKNAARCGRPGDPPCCSGLCKRKRGTHKLTCHAAPSEGVCTILKDRCAGDTTICGTDRAGDCRCYITNAGLSVCGSNQYVYLGSGPCETDADCDEQYGSPAACIKAPGDCCTDPPCFPTGCVLHCKHVS